jgi:putative transposase
MFCASSFVDLAPAQVHATLLEEGRSLCSVQTMQRILWENDEAKERWNQARHPVYTRPELMAERPIICRLGTSPSSGGRGGAYDHRRVILDLLFSRYVFGWMVAPRETGMLAEHFIAETCQRVLGGPVDAPLRPGAQRSRSSWSRSFSRTWA